MIFIVLVYLVSLVRGYTIGSSFFDGFQKHNSDLWNLNDATVFCKEDCACAKKKSLSYQHYLPEGNVIPTSYELQFHLRDLKHKFCDRNGTCAHFTTGVMTSKDAYPYGSFTVVAKAAAKREHQVGRNKILATGWTCFLGRQLVKKPWYYAKEISMCFSSDDPHYATFRLDYGPGPSDHHEAKINLGFDASYHVAVYAWQWRRETVAFLVNNVVRKTWVSSKNLMPNMYYGPMQIEVSLLPSAQAKMPLPPNLAVSMSMKVVSIQYSVYHSEIHSHDELFVIEDEQSYKIIIITISLIIVAAMFVTGLSYYIRKRIEAPNPYGYSKLSAGTFSEIEAVTPYKT